MAKLKIASGRPSVAKVAKAANFPQMSVTMYRDTLGIIKQVCDSGSSNFIQGYYSSNWINDFLHSAGLITDQCYQDNRVWGDIFGLENVAEGILGSITSGNAGILTPTLRTKTIAQSEKNALEDTGAASATLVPDVDTTLG